MTSRHRLALGLVLLIAAAPVPVWSHPLGNFSIDHYARLRVATDSLRLRFVIDMAEIPAVEALLLADTNGDRILADSEQRAYLDRTVTDLLAHLAVTLNGTPIDWRVEHTNLTAPSRIDPAGARSDPATLRVFIDLAARFPASFPAKGVVTYRDTNFPQRTGWREVVVVSDLGVRLLESSAPSEDLSNELTRYPPTLAPPQRVEAAFTFDTGPAGWLEVVLAPSSIWPVVIVALFGGLLTLRYREGRTGARSLQP